jgi:hypothetical protein
MDYAFLMALAYACSSGVPGTPEEFCDKVLKLREEFGILMSEGGDSDFAPPSFEPLDPV